MLDQILDVVVVGCQLLLAVLCVVGGSETVVLLALRQQGMKTKGDPAAFNARFLYSFLANASLFFFKLSFGTLPP